MIVPSEILSAKIPASIFSAVATYSISLVIVPSRAYDNCVAIVKSYLVILFKSIVQFVSAFAKRHLPIFKKSNMSKTTDDTPVA
jgi:hypothetical protein